MFSHSLGKTMQNGIKDARFFRGGNATLTVNNNKGEHYTFKIRKPVENAPFFVSLLTGPDNENSFSYMGIFNPKELSVRTTAKSKFTADSKPVKVLNWAIKTVANMKDIPEGYGIRHEGKCCRCGRKLTTPDSIENGIGPECIKKGGF